MSKSRKNMIFSTNPVFCLNIWLLADLNVLFEYHLKEDTYVVRIKCFPYHKNKNNVYMLSNEPYIVLKEKLYHPIWNWSGSAPVAPKKLKVEGWRLKVEGWRLKVEGWERRVARNWRLKVEDWKFSKNI